MAIANGTHPDLGFTVGNSIFTSADSGTTWTTTAAPFDYWRCVASSADGTSLAAVTTYANPAGSGRIYVSTNAGATWVATGAPVPWPTAAISMFPSAEEATEVHQVAGALVAFVLAPEFVEV